MKLPEPELFFFLSPKSNHLQRRWCAFKIKHWRPHARPPAPQTHANETARAHAVLSDKRSLLNTKWPNMISAGNYIADEQEMEVEVQKPTGEAPSQSHCLWKYYTESDTSWKESFFHILIISEIFWPRYDRIGLETEASVPAGVIWQLSDLRNAESPQNRPIKSALSPPSLSLSRSLSSTDRS